MRKRRNAFAATRILQSHMTKLILSELFFAATTFAAQAFSVGVIGGAPFTDVVNATTTGNIETVPTSTNFTIGPVVQVNLPLSFRVEADALYRPYSFSQTLAGSITNISAAQWRFPVLLQYRLGSGESRVRPFVGVGASFEHLTDISAAAKNITAGPGQLLQQSNAAVVLGGGVDLKVPFVRVSA